MKGLSWPVNLLAFFSDAPCPNFFGWCACWYTQIRIQDSMIGKPMFTHSRLVFSRKFTRSTANVELGPIWLSAQLLQLLFSERGTRDDSEKGGRFQSTQRTSQWRLNTLNLSLGATIANRTTWSLRHSAIFFEEKDYVPRSTAQTAIFTFLELKISKALAKSAAVTVARCFFTDFPMWHACTRTGGGPVAFYLNITHRWVSTLYSFFFHLYRITTADIASNVAYNSAHSTGLEHFYFKYTPSCVPQSEIVRFRKAGWCADGGLGDHSKIICVSYDTTCERSMSDCNCFPPSARFKLEACAGSSTRALQCFSADLNHTVEILKLMMHSSFAGAFCTFWRSGLYIARECWDIQVITRPQK